MLPTMFYNQILLAVLLSCNRSPSTYNLGKSLFMMKHYEDASIQNVTVAGLNSKACQLPSMLSGDQQHCCRLHSCYTLPLPGTREQYHLPS